MKYLILGKNGQLGNAFVKYLANQKKNFSALSHEECDISDLNIVLKVLEDYKPDIVINCAAYNLVDKAESEYWNAYKTNALGVKNLAYACKEYNSYLITYSTDYVFDGTKENGLYTEEDIPNPLNEYGKSKLTGENWLMEENPEKYLIFRTSWVYGEGKQNFIYKLMQWTKNNDYLKIAYDEISVPTSTRTIVNVSLKAIDKGLTGLFHLTNTEYASRYEWAKKIFEIKRIKKFIYPVSKDIFNLPAKRPKFSAMDNQKISSMLDTNIPTWYEELGYIIKNIVI
ncbi:dTDP-4-dehydrorhamnose reductase [Persephonella sp. KM09-Lau-8]|uniref:dTDP-4-dehydrorhamnose reductase n=1 Tax=Persephonella sp. KM09-Lau-8 TaxID=1158345 RepID=UPI000495CA51|nr:dTDP-4-dehydrorhamnose reductase [Persephonella sp. KM09-Lau-8]